MSGMFEFSFGLNRLEGIALKRKNCFIALVAIQLIILMLTGCSCKPFVGLLSENTEKSTPSPNQEDYATAYEYYSNNAEVIETEKVQDSDDVLTEADVLSLLYNRGFTAYPITYSYDTSGKYCGDTEADNTSADKHPMYNTFYVSSVGEVWTIYVIEGSVYAYPALFNLETESAQQLIISESTEVVSYDDTSNTFFVTIPSETTTIVKIVEKIDAETLDRLTREELGN